MARIIRHPQIERVLLTLKTAKDWIVAKLVGLFVHFAKKLPATRSINAAEKLARFLSPVLPRTALTRRNLALAFPEKSSAEIRQMTRGVWGNVGRTIAEYIFLDELIDIDLENPQNGRIEVHGIDQFVNLRESNRPVVIFTAHTGNWEILPVAAAAYDLTVTALFRPPNNRFLAKRVLKARKTEGGHLVPSRAGAAWALASVLENNGAVGLLSDQAFTRGPRVSFMGREATANPLAAKLARQFDCDIHPARCVRLPSGRFKIELQGPIDIPRNDDGKIDLTATTQKLADIVEGWVREYPEQWLWLHDRWKIKTPPPGKRRRNRY
ncbi:MAG: lipid A biosynthesis lauroyl acyltransferase [Rhizobiaceae bacterium]|nr:lipid A biosynthesis lauroyl acyltransferase [Rhizobiaceae bacterium]